MGTLLETLLGKSGAGVGMGQIVGDPCRPGFCWVLRVCPSHCGAWPDLAVAILPSSVCVCVYVHVCVYT